MSNYYIGNIYAPLPSSSNYSSWATVSYSLDPADASGVVSTQGHLVKSTIRARDEYISYIEPNNLRSGWGGSYTWRSGEMNVNEGPAQNNCAFYVKYKGQWINLKDNTAVEQAGLDSIFERQTISSQPLYHYVVLYVWENSDEDKYRFGYTVKIKQNCPLEDFKDSTDEAAIIQFLADINSENTGSYYDITLGRTSPSFQITEAVEEIWETGTGSLIPGTWNYGNYKDTNVQGTQINFPSVKRTLTYTPWLSASSVGKLIDPHFSDSANTGTDEVYALKKGCLLGLNNYDSYSSGEGADKGSIVVVGEAGKLFGLDVALNMSTLLSNLKSNPDDYNAYRAPYDYYCMLDVSAGGGGGGNGYRITGLEGTGGGGGGAGGSCRLVVFVSKGGLLLFERGDKGNARQDGRESRVCLLNPSNEISAGVVCDGGHAGFDAGRNDYGGGGNGGAVYWAAADGVSRGDNITYENGAGTTVVQWDGTTDNNSGLSRNSIYVIFAATGGWGGHGGQQNALIPNVNCQYGWAPIYNDSPFSAINMITNTLSTVTYNNKSLPGGCSNLSESGMTSEADFVAPFIGGGGGCNFSYWVNCKGGFDGSSTAKQGAYGGGGSGGNTEGSSGYQGGSGYVIISR